LANVKTIFSSETAWPNGAKLGIYGPWVCPFQNCVRQPPPQKIVLTLANQKKELILAAMFVGRMEPNEEAL
jgi:hypothetical protein